MCFGGKQQPAPTPAPAPPPPEQPAQEATIGKARTDEQGSTKPPNLRVDRSSVAGSATAGGAGIRM